MKTYAPEEIQEAKRRLNIFKQWEMFNLPGDPHKNPCQHPFRQDRKPSFSVSPDGLVCNDFADSRFTASSSDGAGLAKAGWRWVLQGLWPRVATSARGDLDIADKQLAALIIRIGNAVDHTEAAFGNKPSKHFFVIGYGFKELADCFPMLRAKGNAQFHVLSFSGPCEIRASSGHDFE